MDQRYARDPEVKKVILRCMDGFLIIRKQIDSLVTEIRNKIEDPELTDSEIRSYLGQLKGIKKALELIPKEESK